jgi:hypothetical protein
VPAGGPAWKGAPLEEEEEEEEEVEDEPPPEDEVLPPEDDVLPPEDDVLPPLERLTLLRVDEDCTPPPELPPPLPQPTTTASTESMKTIPSRPRRLLFTRIIELH